MSRQQRRRLDNALVSRGLAESRPHAIELMNANRVLVDGAIANNPARLVGVGQALEVKGPPPRFVSRAGEKLAHGLEVFGVDPAGLRCLDAGSSTGGFTDCLLQHGAAQVWAVDVGTNQLHERVRKDARVVVKEQTDIRSVRLDDTQEPFDLIVVDVSFISIGSVFGALTDLIKPLAPIIGLVKPQFEVTKQEASRGSGVITDPSLWARVLGEVVEMGGELGWRLDGLTVSPITGAKGNVEFVTCWRQGASNLEIVDDGCSSGSSHRMIADLIHQAVAEAEARVS